MKKYKLIIFDLDGTLVDTSDGICRSHMYTNAVMGKPITDNAVFTGIIGGPLLQTYQERFHYLKKDAIKAVKIYRDYYATEAYKWSVLYSGISECLACLNEWKYKLAVATLKEENLAKQVLNMLGIGWYFDGIWGVDTKDSLNKKDLIEKCMHLLGIGKKEAILVGDTEYDAEGAKQADIDFLGVTYGFGFSGESEYEKEHGIRVVNSCNGLKEWFS